MKIDDQERDLEVSRLIHNLNYIKEVKFGACNSLRLVFKMIVKVPHGLVGFKQEHKMKK